MMDIDTEKPDTVLEDFDALSPEEQILTREHVLSFKSNPEEENKFNQFHRFYSQKRQQETVVNNPTL